jgi:hypothetical protein
MEKRLPYTLLRLSPIKNINPLFGQSQELGVHSIKINPIYKDAKESFVSTTRFPTFKTDISYIPQNIEINKNIQDDLIRTQDDLLKSYTDLSQNMNMYLSQTKLLQDNNDKYHFNDTQDPNVIVRPEDSKDIKTAIMNDVNEIKLYQNSIYVATSIAAATFLIAIIIMTKK